MSRFSAPNRARHGRYDELDGLRALSVLGIAAFHLFPVSGLWFTVDLFFVLSGFFITKNLREIQDAPLRQYLATFYGRRIVRIVPPYFSYIAALSVFYGFFGQPDLLPQYVVSLLTFTFNQTRAVLNWVSCDFIAHFWSLSVEAQFYLIWPWFIALCPRRSFQAVLVALLFLPLPWRYAYSEWLLARGIPLSHIADSVYWTTWGHVDSFAAGALVALAETSPQHRRRSWQRIGFGALILVGVSNVVYLGSLHGYSAPLFASLGYPIFNTQAYQHVWAGSILTIGWGTLLWRLADHGDSVWWFARMLRARFLVTIGRLSYGMYIWHWAVLLLLSSFFPSESFWLRVLVLLPLIWTVTFLIATCSYRFIELPLLRRFAPERRAAHE